MILHQIFKRVAPAAVSARSQASNAIENRSPREARPHLPPPARSVGRSQASVPLNLEATLVVRKSPAAEALEEAVSWVFERVQQERDTDDVLSTDAEDDLPSPVSSTALRARARLRVHLKTLLVSTNIEMVKKALVLCEEASVRLATRQLYMKAKKDLAGFASACRRL